MRFLVRRWSHHRKANYDSPSLTCLILRHHVFNSWRTTNDNQHVRINIEKWKNWYSKSFRKEFENHSKHCYSLTQTNEWNDHQSITSHGSLEQYSPCSIWLPSMMRRCNNEKLYENTNITSYNLHLWVPQFNVQTRMSIDINNNKRRSKLDELSCFDSPNFKIFQFSYSNDVLRWENATIVLFHTFSIPSISAPFMLRQKSLFQRTRVKLQFTNLFTVNESIHS